MNSGNDDQRWRGSNQQRGGQGGGQRRNMPRDGNYSGGYNNSNGSNAWGRGNMNQNMHHHNQGQQTSANSNAGYYEQHVPVNGFNTQEALDLLTRAARAPGPEAEKPILYKGDKGWSTPKGNSSAWGQKRKLDNPIVCVNIDGDVGNAMASGGDFLVQLKKSHAAFQQNVGRE
ncbi:hypothetical protein FN846DRAFT_291509 [Sphaerosporella brunnea]|uniref:Uncharacterized protein n=1 Tax=Sphaerosporella brunnea TaxID=1250544 RepID=A0A5J5EN14_9PEZI|nr:hypothetical protein FN846DRAFT_291509 [Sphaerosporella brunnea]